MLSEWSGSGVVAAFEGDSVSVSLNDGGSNQFTVVVDGELQPKLVAMSGQRSYPLASGLGAGPHQVELYRRTEASFGSTAFLGFDFGANGRLLVPPPTPARSIELVGDSITCGYGDEGQSATCSFSADTENHYATYGAIAARELGAELVTIAWSGKGLVYNYDTDMVDPMPALYDRTLPTEADSQWSFSKAPDAVVINLGTNDFSTDGDPSPDLFHDRAVALLQHLRDVYPDAFILWTVGPLLSGADLDAARSGIQAAVATQKSAGDEAVEVWEMNIPNDNPGCDYHPGLATHQAMADALVEQLSMWLGW
jgi:lysophospholipase L1-like esterase